ncbi:MAG: DUF1465 family protein [Alphaproteobacteria bacterium]|nr:DUF1465 family protein [Alphaproteobacteria bacterium]
MSNESCVGSQAAALGVTVSFGEQFQASANFDVVFKEGMALVERTASYLDGKGRQESKGLVQPTTVLYATESMRLTTRLLDLASWLLVRRALKDGDITSEEAKVKRARIKLQGLGRPSHTKGFDDLPEGLQGLVEESFLLHDRIVQLDRAMNLDGQIGGADNVTAINPVAAQMQRLSAAFGSKLS